MHNIWTIAQREYKLYFATPIAYMVAFMILLIIGFIFYVNLSAAMVQQFAPGVDIVLGPLVTLLLFGTPAITMRLIAEEQRMGTIELLLTAPVRDYELVVGKWLGGCIFLLLWLISMPSDAIGSIGATLLNYLDFSEHFYQTLFRGVIDLRDIVYYLSVTALALFMGTMAVETRRGR